ncbi:diaminopimelate epimerase [Thermodesulfobacteriota bacterium]
MRTINFTKMHGIGNDFVVIDCRENDIREIDNFAKRLCDRRFGIGADQLLLIYDSDIADFYMAIFNADGSEVEMCGNGIRCFAKYLVDRKITNKTRLDVETPAGIIKPEIIGDSVKVNMGAPILDGRKIPLDHDGEVIDFPLTVDGKEFNVTAVSMGNPHCVTFVDDVNAFDLDRFGPLFERHVLFPNRVNFEVIDIINDHEINMRVYERGAAETLACGTGACASAVAAHLNKKTGNNVLVHLRGGDLNIEIADDGNVYMTGPAKEVFTGEISL